MELEDALSEVLEGRIQAATMEVDGETTLRLQLVAKAGGEPRQLARTASDLGGRRAHTWSELPERLRVEVRSTTAPPVVVETRPPGLEGLRSGRQRTKAPATPPPK